jgi:hypothetical protein
MSDHDHGAYTPSSERLSFDPREPVRSGGPPPITLIVSGLVLLAIVVGAFLLYRGGVRPKGEAPAAVGAPLPQIRTPAAPDANALPPGLSVSKFDATAANATFAPPPEEPLPRPSPVQAPSVVTSTPLPPPSGQASTPPPPRTLTSPPAKPAKPVTIASLTDDALGPRGAARPVVKVAPKPPLAPAVASAAVETSGAAPPPGAGWVQIGAFSSSALAEKGWSDVAALAPAGMAGKGRRVEALAKDGKTLYRAYVTGFSSRDAALAFCERLKAAGKACFVK